MLNVKLKDNIRNTIIRQRTSDRHSPIRNQYEMEMAGHIARMKEIDGLLEAQSGR